MTEETKNEASVTVVLKTLCITNVDNKYVKNWNLRCGLEREEF
jgi:hypothetical protein